VGWHGFRRGVATNLERIGVRESIAAMILRHTNERVTRKYYIKPPSSEARAALPSEAFSNVGSVKLLPKNCSPNVSKAGRHYWSELGDSKARVDVNVCD
jgi:hypothetical protein